MLISQSFRDLQTEIGADKAAQAMKRKMAQLRKESKQQVQLMKDLAMKSPRTKTLVMLCWRSSHGLMTS